MTLKVGLIGCGNVVSYGHRPALQALEDVELVALADVTEARRRIGQEWFNLPDDALYETHRALLDNADVDAVVITVPQQFRPEIVMDAITANKHILSEQPLATTPAVADQFIREADNRGLIFGMVHNYIYLPEYTLLKSLLEENHIGNLRVATLHYLGVIDYPGASEFQSDWRHTMSAGGGVLMDMLHAIYLTEWLFDAPATQVMAFIDALEYTDRSPKVEDTAMVQIAFPSGYAAVHMGWGEGVGGVDLSGENGQIRMRYEQYQTSGFNRPAELYSINTDWERADYVMDNEPNHMENIARSFTRLWEDFADAVDKHRPTVMSARVGKRALDITLGAYLSGVTGQVVKLPLEPETSIYEKGIAGLAEVDGWDESRTIAAGLFNTR